MSIPKIHGFICPYKDTEDQRFDFCSEQNFDSRHPVVYVAKNEPHKRHPH